MPHLQFEINTRVSDEVKRELAGSVQTLFAEVMDTGVDHIAITIREYGLYNLYLGRVKDHEQGIALVNADIRAGRTQEQRRTLALGFIRELQRLLSIPPENVYVTFTEHKGEDFHLNERFLASWQPGEDPLAA